MSSIYVIVHWGMGDDMPRWAFTKKRDAEAFRQRLVDEIGECYDDSILHTRCAVNESTGELIDPISFFTIEKVPLDPAFNEAAGMLARVLGK